MAFRKQISYLLLAVISVGDPLGDTLLPVDWKGLEGLTC